MDIYTHTALVRKSQSVEQDDPNLYESDRQGKQSHRCRAGLVALGPQILPGCLNILTQPSVPEVQSFRGLLD